MPRDTIQTVSHWVGEYVSEQNDGQSWFLSKDEQHDGKNLTLDPLFPFNRIWVNYNNLTATWESWWSWGKSSPFYGRTIQVNEILYNLPRFLWHSKTRCFLDWNIIFNHYYKQIGSREKLQFLLTGNLADVGRRHDARNHKLGRAAQIGCSDLLSSRVAEKMEENRTCGRNNLHTWLLFFKVWRKNNNNYYYHDDGWFYVRIWFFEINKSMRKRRINSVTLQ